MDLGRYPSEVKAIADELSDLVRGPIKLAASRVMQRIGEAGFLKMSEVESDKAIKLLSQTPSQRTKTLGKLDDEAAALLILRARYMGLCSHRALEFADRFDNVRGRSYRSAAELGARAAMYARLRPSMTEVLTPRYDSYADLLDEEILDDDEPEDDVPGLGR